MRALDVKIEYFNSIEVQKPEGFSWIDNRGKNRSWWTGDAIHLGKALPPKKCPAREWAQLFIEGTSLKDIVSDRIKDVEGADKITSWDCFLQSYHYPAVKISNLSDDDYESQQAARTESGKTHEEVRKLADKNPFKTLEETQEEEKAFSEPKFVKDMIAARDKYQQVADQVNAAPAEINKIINKINTIDEAYQQVFHKYNIDSLIGLAVDCIKSQIEPEIAATIPSPNVVIGSGIIGVGAPPWAPPKLPKVPTKFLPDAPVFDLDGEFYIEIENMTKEAILQTIVMSLLELVRELLKECIANPRQFPEEVDLTTGPVGQDLDDGLPALNLDDLQGIGINSDAAEDLKDLAGDLTALLNPYEICALLKGEASRLVIDLLRRYVRSKYPGSHLAAAFANRNTIIAAFRKIGNKIDLSICEALPDPEDFPYTPVCADNLRCALIESMDLPREEVVRMCEEGKIKDIDRAHKLLDLLSGTMFDDILPDCFADLAGLPPEPPSSTHIADKVISFLYEPSAMTFDKELSYFLFDRLNFNSTTFAQQPSLSIPAYEANGTAWKNWLNGDEDAGWNSDTRGIMIFTDNKGYGSGGGADVSDQIASNPSNYLPGGGLEGQDWKKRALAFARLNQMPFVRSHHGGGYAITGKMAKNFSAKGSMGMMGGDPFPRVKAVISGLAYSMREGTGAPIGPWSVTWREYGVARDLGYCSWVAYHFDGPIEGEGAESETSVEYIAYRLQKPSTHEGTTMYSPGFDGEVDPYNYSYKSLTLRFPPLPGETETRQIIKSFVKEVPPEIASYSKTYVPIPIDTTEDGSSQLDVPAELLSFAEYVGKLWTNAFAPQLGTMERDYFDTEILPKIKKSYMYGDGGYYEGGRGRHDDGIYNDIFLSILRSVFEGYLESPMFDKLQLINLDLLGSQQCPPSLPGFLLDLPPMIEEIKKQRLKNLCHEDALSAPAIEATVKAIIKLYVLDYLIRVMYLFSFFRVSELVEENDLIADVILDDVIAKMRISNGPLFNHIARFAKAIVADRITAEEGRPPKNELSTLIKNIKALSKNVVDSTVRKTRHKDSRLSKRKPPPQPRVVASPPLDPFDPATFTIGTAVDLSDEAEELTNNYNIPEVDENGEPYPEWVDDQTETSDDRLYSLTPELAVRELVVEQMRDVSEFFEEIIKPIRGTDMLQTETMKMQILKDWKQGGTVLERNLGYPDQFMNLVNDPDHGEDYRELLEQGTFLLEKFIKVERVEDVDLPNDDLGNYLRDLDPFEDRDVIGNISPSNANNLMENCITRKPEIVTPAGFEVDAEIFTKYFKSWKYGLRLSYAPSSDMGAIDWSEGVVSADSWTLQGTEQNIFYDTIKEQLSRTQYSEAGDVEGASVPDKVERAMNETKAFFLNEKIDTTELTITPPAVDLLPEEHPGGTVWCWVVPTFAQRRWRGTSSRVLNSNPMATSDPNNLAKNRMAYHQDHTGQLINNKWAAFHYGWYLREVGGSTDYGNAGAFQHCGLNQCVNLCNEILLVRPGAHPSSAGHAADHDSFGGRSLGWWAGGPYVGWLSSNIYGDKDDVDDNPVKYYGHNNRPQPYIHMSCLNIGLKTSGVAAPSGNPGKPNRGPRYGGWLPYIDADGNTDESGNNRPGNYSRQGPLYQDGYNTPQNFPISYHKAHDHADRYLPKTAGNSNSRMMRFHDGWTGSTDEPTQHLGAGRQHAKIGGGTSMWSVCRPGFFESGWVEVAVGPGSGLSQADIDKLKLMDINHPDGGQFADYDSTGDRKNWRYKNGLSVTDVNGQKWYCVGVGSGAGVDLDTSETFMPHPAFYNADGSKRYINFQPADYDMDVEVAVEVNSTPLVSVLRDIPGTGTKDKTTGAISIVPVTQPADGGAAITGPMTFSPASFDWAYEANFERLKELLVEKQEFSYLFEYVIPIADIRSVAAIYGLILGLSYDSDFGFPGTRDKLKDLLDILLFGDDYRFEAESVVRTGGSAQLKACMDQNASTDPAGAFNKEIAKMIFMTPLMILKGLGKLLSPNIMVTELIKSEINSLISQIQGIVQQTADMVTDPMDELQNNAQELQGAMHDIDVQFEMAVADRGVCAVVDDRSQLPDMPPFLRELINTIATTPDGQKPYEDITTGALNMNWQLPEDLLPLSTPEISMMLGPIDLFLGPGPPLGPIGLLIMLIDFLEPKEQAQMQQALANQARINNGNDSGCE